MPNEAQSGHLYVQTSAIHNAIVHFLRASDGTVTEADRVLTGGAGSGPFNYSRNPARSHCRGGQQRSHDAR